MKILPFLVKLRWAPHFCSTCPLFQIVLMSSGLLKYIPDLFKWQREKQVSKVDGICPKSISFIAMCSVNKIPSNNMQKNSWGCSWPTSKRAAPIIYIVEQKVMSFQAIDLFWDISITITRLQFSSLNLASGLKLVDKWYIRWIISSLKWLIILRCIQSL